MEDETVASLDLLPYFNGRTIHDFTDWSTRISLEITRFLKTFAETGGSFRLRIDAHMSIAMLAGYELDTKAGAKISIVQKTRNGVEVWDVAKVAEGPTTGWDFLNVDGNSEDGGLFVAVSITHDVFDDVSAFLNCSGLTVRRILSASVKGGTGNTAIREGGQVLRLVLDLVKKLRTFRKADQKFHLFVAAPNAFSFVLGQQLRGLGPVVVYEFNFETGKVGAYEPTMTFNEGATR